MDRLAIMAKLCDCTHHLYLLKNDFFMNVMFHIATGLSTAVLLTDTSEINRNSAYKKILPIALFGFVIGIISHGALDYIPHCYPINSKLDILLGLLSILILLLISKEKYKLIFLGSLIGCVFPDIVDLLPSMLNTSLRLELPVLEKLFPWHWKQYSGSIYTDECNVSFINHSLVLLTVSLILWSRKKDFMTLLVNNKSD